MALAPDGSAHANDSATSVAPVLTTANSNDIIIAIATVNGGPVTGISGGSLTWNFIAESEGSADQLEMWYAVAASPLSSEAITITQTSSAFITADVFGISGADTSTIFDANVSTPAVSPTAILSVSTDTADTFIVVGYRFGSEATPTEGTGFTKISGADFQLSEFKIVSSTQSSLSMAIGTGNGDQNGGVAVALIIAAAGGATPKGPLGHPFHGPLAGPIGSALVLAANDIVSNIPLMKDAA